MKKAKEIKIVVKGDDGSVLYERALDSVEVQLLSVGIIDFRNVLNDVIRKIKADDDNGK